MKRISHVTMLLVAIALIAADKGEQKKEGDAEKIQGKWIVVESYRKGEKVDTSVGDVVTFSGKKLTIVQAGSKFEVEAVFELRPDKKPPELDMTKRTTITAIYELAGDTLKICALDFGKGRPDAVGTAADDNRTLRVLKRVKSDDKK